MPSKGGPNIITDGLVFAVDAADKLSYPGNGTTWKDLSGNGNDGTLVNGPTFDSGNGGSIVFDGNNDYVDLGNINSNNSINLGGSDITISAWVYRNPTGDGFQRIIDKSNGPNASNGYALMMDSSNGYYFSINGNNLNTSTPIITEQWINFTATRNSSNRKIYINNELITTGSANSIPNTETNMRIGSWNHSTGREFNGKISFIHIYNRALTPQEISQNYNALKSRFNL